MTVAELLEQLKDCDPSLVVCVDTTGFTTSGIYPVEDQVWTYKDVVVSPSKEAYSIVVLNPSKWP
jgi:hypothetical protein